MKRFLHFATVALGIALLGAVFEARMQALLKGFHTNKGFPRASVAIAGPQVYMVSLANRFLPAAMEPLDHL